MFYSIRKEVRAVIYPSQVTRLKRFLEDFLRQYEAHAKINQEAAVSRYGGLEKRALKLHEMLQLELVPVGPEERRSE